MLGVNSNAGTRIEDFHFWVPISKAREEVSKVPGKPPIRKIRGVASTEHRDLQGEVVHMPGLDFDYFLKHGYFNNDHKPGAGNKIGEPEKALITPNNEFYVEGFLYNDHPIADDYWRLMETHGKNPHANRQVGFSVQGKVKRRSGNQILNCWVQDVALTPAPINTKTWAQIVKSLTTGYATSNQTDGAVLRPENLTPKIAKQTFDEKDIFGRKSSRRLNKAQAVQFLQMESGYSRSTARAIVEAHFSGVI
jgi:hypothetical protein